MHLLVLDDTGVLLAVFLSLKQFQGTELCGYKAA